MKIYSLVIRGSFGMDFQSFISKEARTEYLAKWARDRWEYRACKSTDNDHTIYDDIEVIHHYFKHTGETFFFGQSEVPDYGLLIGDLLKTVEDWSHLLVRAETLARNSITEPGDEAETLATDIENALKKNVLKEIRT
jgi:hypothetical protein